MTRIESKKWEERNEGRKKERKRKKKKRERCSGTKRLGIAINSYYVMNVDFVPHSH
jgi:hypothetical protein